MPRQRKATRAASQGLIHTVQEEDHLGEQEGTSAMRLQDQPQTTAPDIQVAVNAAIQQFSPTIATLMTAMVEMQKSIQVLTSQSPISQSLRALHPVPITHPVLSQDPGLAPPAHIQPSRPGLVLDTAQAPVSRPPLPWSSGPSTVGLAAPQPPAPRIALARSTSETHESIEMEPNPNITSRNLNTSHSPGLLQSTFPDDRPPAADTTHVQTMPQQVAHHHQPLSTIVIPSMPQVVPSGGSGARIITTGHKPSHASYVTKHDLDALLHRLKQSSLPHSPSKLSGHAPYSGSLATKPYPVKYKQPSFTLFNGKEGNAREHLTRFAGSLEHYGEDDTLKLREFHKSLTGLAYSWYHQIPDSTIHSWSDMVQLFLDKFHYETERVTIVDIAGIRQNPGEDLNTYVTRFHHKCLECTDFSKDETLVPICIKNMKDTYRVYLENLQLRSWRHLKEAARRTYDSVGPSKTPKPPPHIALATTMEAASNDDNNRKRQSQGRDGRPDKRGQPMPAPEYPCDLKTVRDLLETWINDNAITLPNVDSEPTPEDLAHHNYCPYHRKVGHGLKWCRGLKFVFADKIASGELKL